MVNIEMLNDDQLTRLREIGACIDDVLRDLMSETEVFELLGVRLCFDLRDMDEGEVVFVQDRTDPTGRTVIAHLEPRPEPASPQDPKQCCV